MLEELYQEIILDHYRRPRNRGHADPADVSARDTNPLCGDEIEISATLKDGKIAEMKFEGKGCAICIASTSIMTQKLKDKGVAEAQVYIEQFLKMMRGDQPFGGRELGELKAMEGVLKFPVRVKCATLAWNTAHKGLREVKLQ